MVTQDELAQERSATPLAVENNGERVPVPAIPATWTCPWVPWHELWRTAWQRVEPSNVVELRTAAMAIQHLGRTRRAWHHRILLVVDNLCALAVIGKGRSKTRILRHAARKVASVVLGTGIRIYLRWVPSKRNIADGPSRNRPLQLSEEVDESDEPIEDEAIGSPYWLRQLAAQSSSTYHG